MDLQPLMIMSQELASTLAVFLQIIGEVFLTTGGGNVS